MPLSKSQNKPKSDNKKPSFPTKKLLPNSIEKLIVRIEKTAIKEEKNWYFQVISETNLSDREIEKYGKKYGLNKKDIAIFQRFAKNPNSFDNDYEWFNCLQKFYVLVAEKELKNRKKNIQKKSDPFMRIYERFVINEMKNPEYRKRYLKHYLHTPLLKNDLKKYVSDEVISIIQKYIKTPLAFMYQDWRITFDAFQRLYINVVKVLRLNLPLNMDVPNVHQQRKKHKEQLLTLLSRDQIRTLLDAPDSSAKGCRNALILNLMYYYAAKVSQIINLKVGNFYKNGTVIQNYTIERGREKYFVAMPDNLKVALNKHLTKNEISKNNEESLLIQKIWKDQKCINKALERTRIYGIFDKYARQIGLSKQIAPHILREMSLHELSKMKPVFTFKD